MAQSQRVDLTEGFVLHHYPWRETSLILEVFSREHGRLSIVARGARRPGSALRGVLLPFQPLLLSWYGKHELKTLHKAEWVGGVRFPAGHALICAYYLNELLLALLPKEDASGELFDHYQHALHALSHGLEQAPVLRQFEQALLSELGYGLLLSHTVEGLPVEAGQRYAYRLQHGLYPARERQRDDIPLDGQTLLDLHHGYYERAETRQQALALMRRLLASLLPERPLATRELFRLLRQLDEPANGRDA